MYAKYTLKNYYCFKNNVSRIERNYYLYECIRSYRERLIVLYRRLLLRAHIDLIKWSALDFLGNINTIVCIVYILVYLCEIVGGTSIDSSIVSRKRQPHVEPGTAIASLEPIERRRQRRTRQRQQKRGRQRTGPASAERGAAHAQRQRGHPRRWRQRLQVRIEPMKYS